MKTDFARRVLSYSAAAAGFLSHSASAQIAYSDIDPDMLYTDNPDFPWFSYPVDMDTDAVAEVVFFFSRYGITSDCFSFGSMSFNALNYASVLLNDANDVKVLDAGDTISTGGNWNNYFSHMLAMTSFSYNICSNDSKYIDQYGNWLYVGPKFMGVRFYSAGEMHYGWIRLSSAIVPDTRHDHVDSIKIYDYAYELTANKSIIAGDEAPVILPVKNITQPALDLFPNPVGDFCTLLLPEKNKYQLTLLSAQGNKIREYADAENNYVIQTADLPAGVYFILVTGNEEKFVLQFIKQ